MKYFRLLRVKHCIKNLLIFFPMIFSGNLNNKLVLYKNLLGFFIFSIVAFGIYIFNDIQDIERDREHSTKCLRPLASGTVSISKAILIMGLLFTVASGLIFITKLPGLKYIIVYLITNILYSKGAKNIPLLDVSILALGYILRLLYGGDLSGTGTSNWMFLTVLSAAFYLGFGKRSIEMKRIGSKGRKSLEEYTKSFLENSQQLFSALLIVFYSLTCADKTTFVAKSNINFVWTVPIVITICLRYNMILERSECDGDPVEVFLSDFTLCLLVFLYGIGSIISLYWNR